MHNLAEMKQRGYLYDIDYVFDVIYIDSYLDLEKLFKKNIKKLIKGDDKQDIKRIQIINEFVGKINQEISKLSGVEIFIGKISAEYKNMNDDKLEIVVRSEIAVKGLYTNIIPYIKEKESDKLYPTSGEGRKKLLAYSILNLLSRENEFKKINLFLIEEPENHLHRTIRVALSKQIFSDNEYDYIFLTTHSTYILCEMDDVNLVRISKENKIDSNSYLYNVPEEYKKNKITLNKELTKAMFSNYVLLVEGPSEVTLFQKILSVVDPMYEVKGKYICPVGGVGFTKYYEILKSLKIHYIIKTDNDLRKNKKNEEYAPLGFQRINKIIGPDNSLEIKNLGNNSIESRIKLYSMYQPRLDDIRKQYNIFLSKSDLENDLNDILSKQMEKYFNISDPVKYLQDAKHANMHELTKHLTDDDCYAIYNDYNFECLKRLVEWN